jgi:hypothetical protein
LVEHCTENAGVGGSIPPLGTTTQTSDCSATDQTSLLIVPAAARTALLKPSTCHQQAKRLLNFNSAPPVMLPTGQSKDHS